MNVIFDRQHRQITINNDSYDRILSIELLNGLIFSIKHSTQNATLLHTLVNTDNELDECTAIALISYLWNERQIALHIEGYDHFNYSNISLSYHVILKDIDVFDVMIGEYKDTSYSIHLSSSEIKYRDLETIQRCTHPASDNLHLRVWEETHLAVENCSNSTNSLIPYDDFSTSLSNTEDEGEYIMTIPSSTDSEVDCENMDELIALCSGTFYTAGSIKATIENPNLNTKGEGYSEPPYLSNGAPEIMENIYPLQGQHFDNQVEHN